MSKWMVTSHPYLVNFSRFLIIVNNILMVLTMLLDPSVKPQIYQNRHLRPKLIDSGSYQFSDPETFPQKKGDCDQSVESSGDTPTVVQRKPHKEK